MSDQTALDEYRTNIELWKHDDTLRQSRNQTFLAANSAALVAAGLVIVASESLTVQGTTAVVAALFGYALSDAWKTVQARHNAYIRFHRLNLLALEEHIEFSTYRNQQRAFHEREVVLLASEQFTLRGRELRSSSDAEAGLPKIISALWIAAGAAGIAALFVGLI